MNRILVINPGSTSTKVAVYEGDQPVFEKSLSHSNADLERFSTIYEQYGFRKMAIEQSLDEAGIMPDQLTAVVGRGGGLRPLRGGVYRVKARMLEDCRIGYSASHASNLGAIIAHEIAAENGLAAFVVDPPVVDELNDLARVSGLPSMSRKSLFHALNQKATAYRAAAAMGIEYAQARIIVAHLGGGITIGAHEHGRVVDVNNGYDAEGPMAPERAGTLPVGDVVKLCFSGRYSHDEVKRMLVGAGGMVAHLGTNDMRRVREMIEAGDRRAEQVFGAMAYQVAKAIGGCAAALAGKVDAIVLTGGIAHDSKFVSSIVERVAWIAPVKVYPGEDELEALALGALRVLEERETPKEYDEGNFVVTQGSA